MTKRDHDSENITGQWLVGGGDERITGDPATGLNRYGFTALPEADVPAYGSSTASAISARSFMAAHQLRLRLPHDSADQYAAEMDRIRTELHNFIQMPGVDIIFTDSGTTSHLVAAQLIAEIRVLPLSVVMMSPAETGSGVPAALGGNHFSQHTPHGGQVTANSSIGPDCDIAVTVIDIRTKDGIPRPIGEINTETENRARQDISSSRHVMINIADCSKTGLVAPGIGSVINLRNSFPDKIDVLVDACQYRLTSETLRAYLEQGFMVCITGSKFMSGPSFSGAILIPDTLARDMRKRPLRAPLAQYSVRGDWPADWETRATLPHRPNYGLLLRWEAAMVEMRDFHTLPPSAVKDFFDAFGKAVGDRIASDSAFEELVTPPIERAPFKNDSWDSCQTIFPFLLRHADGTFLSREETKLVYERTGRGTGQPPLYRCRVGQPVLCGDRNGIPVSALRLCLSAPLAVQALSAGDRGIKNVIAEALLVMDNIAALASI